MCVGGMHTPRHPDYALGHCVSMQDIVREAALLAFVDESGDTGRKILNRSSLYFVVAVVIFRDSDDAQACEHAIRRLRHSLNLSAQYEFHYAENSFRVKEAFLRTVSTNRVLRNQPQEVELRRRYLLSHEAGRERCGIEGSRFAWPLSFRLERQAAHAGDFSGTRPISYSILSQAGILSKEIRLGENLALVPSPLMGEGWEGGESVSLAP